MNSDDILLLAKFIENLSFLINSASSEINVESWILMFAEFGQKEKITKNKIVTEFLILAIF